MDYLYLFLFTLFFAAVSTLPPGMINMNVAHFSITKGINDAKKFINGVLIVVGFQSFLGFTFATFLKTHPEVNQHLKFIGSIIFCILTLFFLAKAIQTKIQEQEIAIKAQRKGSLLFYGMMLSGLNLLPIPFFSFLSLYLSALFSISFSNSYCITFIVASILGMGLSFYLYIYLFRKVQHKVGFFIQNINFIIAFITGLVAFFTIYSL